MTVPVPDDLFLGLVTYRGSRFGDAATEDGLVHRVATAWTGLGGMATVVVSDRDDWTPDLLPLTADEVRASVDAELDSEARWRAYVAGGPLGGGARAVMTGRRILRRLRYAPPWRRATGPDDPGPRMIRRLANIELSHMRVMEEAAAAGARWVLIVEDDAACGDPRAFAEQLAAFTTAAGERGQPLTVNMSESFSVEDLGIGHLLSSLGDSVEGPWQMFSAARPVTNTVCAVLYRGDFLARLVDELQRTPLRPVIPIDFKLNEALMRLAPTSAPGDCWVASPAPLHQRSGVPVVRF